MAEPLKKNFLFTVIGSGNVAWHLSQALVQSGHSFHEVYSRNEKSGKELSHQFSGNFHTSLDFSQSPAELFILAVPDLAIPIIASSLILPSTALLLSVSGSFPLKILLGFSKRAAVFYPLQTFSKESVLEYSNIPFLIEAGDPETEDVVYRLAKSISETVYQIDSTTRKKIHLAAVFASNFTNYMLSVSHDLLKKEQVDFDILKPLVFETLKKAFIIGPSKSQTGPAIRGDHETWQNHLQLLDKKEDLKNIYNLISHQINISMKNS